MAPIYKPVDDSESQPLTEDSNTTPLSEPPSPRHAPSSSSASTTSIVLENISGHDHPTKKEFVRYTDNEDDGSHDDRFEELDIEDGPLLGNKPVDSKYKRWLYVLGAVCVLGWSVALALFVINGSYKHRSNVEHDPLATSSAGSGKKVTLDQVLTGAWFSKGHEISWITDPSGQDGMLLEKSAPEKDYLLVEDVRGWENKEQATHSKSLMKKGNFKFGDQWVFPVEVWPSPDLRTVLVMANKEGSWRHSYTGDYFLFDVETQIPQPLDAAPDAGRVQLATWSPKSDAVVFTRDNNMFLRKIDPKADKPETVQITKDGGEEMFNGVPDWVYEEEVFSGNSATWWSPDGNYIAFLATDESGVAEYPLQFFIPKETTREPQFGEDTYPEIKNIKYPRAGATNPIVHLRFYDVVKGTVFHVPITNDFKDEDRLITEVIWAGESGNVLIRETNRESDILKMVVINVTHRKGSIAREEDVNALDGGWFEVSETTTFVPRDPDNGRLHDGYLDTVIADGYDHLGYFTPLDAPKPKLLTSGEWEVVKAPSAVDTKNNLVYFIATMEGSTTRQIYSVTLNGTKQTPLIPGDPASYLDVSFSKGAGYALVSYQGPNIPWQKVISTPTLAGDHFEHLVEDNAELKKQAAAHELPLEVYETVEIDGSKFNVLERRPPHFDPRKKYPVLFQLYGGPGSQTVDRKFAVDFQSYVASSLGYLVVTVDGRGTGYIGRKLRCIVRGNIGYWEAYDQIETAKIWSKKPYVDASRLAIWGWSYGGFLTLKTLEMDAGRTFKYGMAVAPVTDWKFYGEFPYVYSRLKTSKSPPSLLLPPIPCQEMVPA